MNKLRRTNFVHVYLCLPRHFHLKSLRNIWDLQSSPKSPWAFPLWRPTSGHITHRTSAVQSHQCSEQKSLRMEPKLLPFSCCWSALCVTHMLLFSTSCCLARYHRDVQLGNIWIHTRAHWPTSASSRRPLGPLFTQVTHLWWACPGLATPVISCSLRRGFHCRAQPAPSGANPPLPTVSLRLNVMESFSESSARMHKSLASNSKTTTSTI